MSGKEKAMKMEDEGLTNFRLRAQRLMNKFLELEERLKIVKGECAKMRSLHEAKVADSGTSKSVISEVGESDHPIGHETTEVISNLRNNNNTAIDLIVLSDDESNNGRNQEEQCRIRANSSTLNRASGETITPMAASNQKKFI